MYMGFSPPTVVFFLSILLGAVLGFFWDVNRVLKKNITIKNRKFIFILDIIFFVVASVLTVDFFYFYTYGGFRFFILIGLFIGFVVYYCTIEKAVYFVLNIFFKFILKILLTFKKFLEILTEKFSNIIIKLQKFIYHKIYLKIHLKIRKIKNKKTYENAEDGHIIEKITKKLNKYIKKNDL